MRLPLIWHLLWPLAITVFASSVAGMIRERGIQSHLAQIHAIDREEAQFLAASDRILRRHTSAMDPMVDIKIYEHDLSVLLEPLHSDLLNNAHAQMITALRMNADLASDETSRIDERNLAEDELAAANVNFVSQLSRITSQTLRQYFTAREGLALQGPLIPASGYALLALCAMMLTIAHGRRLSRRLRAPHAVQPYAKSPEETALITWAQNQTREAATRNSDVEVVTQQRERVEAGLRRTEREVALFRLYVDNLVNNLSAAVVVTDMHHHITTVNRRAHTLLNCDAGMLGQDIAQTILSQTLVQHTDIPITTLLDLPEGSSRRFERLALTDAAGNDVLVDLQLSPYMDESGHPRGYLWIADDVTEAVRTKKQLLASERLAAVGRLSSQVAHEIRNPLSAIGLNAELLEDDFAAYVPADRQDEVLTLLRAIGTEVERLTEVTEGYLHLSRLPHPQIESTDTNEAVCDLLAMLREELRTHGVTVRMQLADPAPRANADPGQLRQALLNIVRNARDAMPKGGPLIVTTISHPDCVEITIADGGTGMSEQEASRVFEPFYTTKRTGTGLGLSLTHQILDEHGGSIQIDGHGGHDGGALVTLRLPHATP